MICNYNEFLLLRFYYDVGKNPDGSTDAAAFTPTLVQMVRDKVEVIRKLEALQEKHKALRTLVQEKLDLEPSLDNLAEAHTRLMQRVENHRKLKRLMEK